MGCSFYSIPVESMQYSAGHNSVILCTSASNGARGYIVLGALIRINQSVLLICQTELMDSASVQEIEEGERPLVAFL